MELPFKKGDVVRFVTVGMPSLDYIRGYRVDTSKPYTVLSCELESKCQTGFKVFIDAEYDKIPYWDSSWFELDKNSIVRSILNDL